VYAPHTSDDIEAMLGAIGAASLDELMRVPDAVATFRPVFPRSSSRERSRSTLRAIRRLRSTSRSSEPERTAIIVRRS
jgi:glycine cleavage system pyridoxal-binding protein P